MLEHGDQVLAQAKRVPDEIRTVATANEWLDPIKPRAIRACTRVTAPRGVQTQHTPTRPPDDLNLVGVDRRAAAKYRLERFALNRPVASACDRKDVPHDALSRHAPGPPLCAREQRLIRLALGNRSWVGLR